MVEKKHEHKAAPAKAEAPKAAPKTKFAEGDRVKLSDGHFGTVVEVPVLDPRWLEDNEQFYSVRLDPWVCEPFLDVNGNRALRYRHPEDAGKPHEEARYRDHEADTLGCVPEGQLSAAPKGK